MIFRKKILDTNFPLYFCWFYWTRSFTISSYSTCKQGNVNMNFCQTHTIQCIRQNVSSVSYKMLIKFGRLRSGTLSWSLSSKSRSQPFSKGAEVGAQKNKLLELELEQISGFNWSWDRALFLALAPTSISALQPFLNSLLVHLTLAAHLHSSPFL